MSTTIDEIARLADVSTATVSRALRGHENVAPKTRQRILDIASKLDYNFTPIASRIALGKKSIGVISPVKAQWFTSKLTAAIEVFLLSQNISVQHFSVDSIETQNDLINQLATTRVVDGLIITTTSLASESIDRLAKLDHIETVTIEVTTDHFSTVFIDNTQAAKDATIHLINLGHKDIAILSGEEFDPLYSPIPSLRKTGYLEALDEANIEIRPELIKDGNFSYRGGAIATEQLFTLSKPPTAILALSDEMAIGAMHTIRRMNLRIPQDVSVVGFDDNDVSKYLDLTTVRQPVSEFGEQACTLLLNHFDNKIKKPERHKLSYRLVIRGTTGPCKN
jgi:DNA-binding LacI/PurR family transcriptional regulator